MSVNIGSIDRLFRLILGLFLIASPFVTQIALFQSTTMTVISAGVGLVLVATSALKFCPLYRIFGLRTCKV